MSAYWGRTWSSHSKSVALDPKRHFSFAALRNAHSITSSVRASRVASTFSPSALADLRLMRSGSLIDCLGHPCFDRLSSLTRHLLSDCVEFLILRRHDLELLAHLRGRQLDKLRRRLHTQQLIGIVKGSPRVRTDILEKLVIVLRGTLDSGGMSRCLLNIEKRSLPNFMLRGVGLASKNGM